MLAALANLTLALAALAIALVATTLIVFATRQENLADVRDRITRLEALTDLDLDFSTKDTTP